jgi:hypothetical protein
MTLGPTPSHDAAPAHDAAPDRRRKRGGGEPESRSYYDLPVIKKPVWESRDIAGYFFLGGLAGAGAAIAFCSDATGRPALAKAAKVGAAAAAHLSVLALIHDLGRRARFVNMLRVFKPTSPMSVGSWILAGFVPAASVSALSAVTGRFRVVGSLATAASAGMGLPVATYTAALMSNTAVPAWREGSEDFPFIFVSSAAGAAAGWGLLLAPVAETGPLVGLGAAAGLTEAVLSRVHQERIGVVKEAFHEGKAGQLMKAAEVVTLSGALVTATSSGSRLRRALGGALLLTGSALTRFGIFEAGIASSADPKYTVLPQRHLPESLRREPAGRPVPPG